MPWYRQYFWLLVFGGIILFTAIITITMICVCKTRFSKRVKVKIQKSFKVKKRNISTIVTDNSLYHSTGQFKVKLPNRTGERHAVSENSMSVLPPYPKVQRVPIHPPPRGIYPEYYTKKENIASDIPNLNDRYSYASYDSVGSILEFDYVNAALPAVPKDYVEVLPVCDMDYDDVEII